jgi:hypothetical protein
MNKLLFLALSSACATTWAQTPATNPMPDGSRDMYVGLGVQSAPRWDGTGSRRYQRCRCSRFNGATAFLFPA